MCILKAEEIEHEKVSNFMVNCLQMLNNTLGTSQPHFTLRANEVFSLFVNSSYVYVQLVGCECCIIAMRTFLVPNI